MVLRWFPKIKHNGRAMHRCGMGQLGDLLAFLPLELACEVIWGDVGGGQQPKRGAFFLFCSGDLDKENRLILVGSSTGV
ncbi:hypothetical protein D3A96_15335 [Robertkochia marina]|nr:hypothetical protein D3A96_15335 [Robertkochia marina]